eukprot:g18604.t1
MLQRCQEEERRECSARVADLALAFRKMGQSQVSKMLLRWAETHGDEDGAFQYIMGHHLDYDLQQSEKAGAYYRKAVELEPNNPLALTDLGDAALACEASVTAKELFRDPDWSQELWEYALENGKCNQCVDNNWALYSPNEKSMRQDMGPVLGIASLPSLATPAITVRLPSGETSVSASELRIVEAQRPLPEGSLSFPKSLTGASA